MSLPNYLYKMSLWYFVIRFNATSQIIKSPLSDTRHPTIDFCPENQTSKAARFALVNVSWPEPVFTESLGFELNITSTYGANTTSLGWGEHRVEYIARNTYNNRDTTCVFYVDVARMLLHTFGDVVPDKQFMFSLECNHCLFFQYCNPMRLFSVTSKRNVCIIYVRQWRPGRQHFLTYS